MIDFAFLEIAYLDEIKAILRQLDDDDRVNTILVLSCESLAARNPQIDLFLRTMSTNIIGGIFPEIIVNGNVYTRGTLIVAYPFESDIITVTEVSKIYTNFNKRLEDVLKIDRLSSTAIAIVDGLSTRIGDFVEALYHNCGNGINVLGGGAGSRTMIQLPSIYTNNGLLEDTAVVAFLKTPSSSGLAHGWKPISDTLKITAANSNIIGEINNRPAFDVYKEFVENHGKIELTKNNFMEIAKSYPLGILNSDSEAVIRDPISTSEGKLTCVGQIPHGCDMQIFQGDIASVLDGAQNAKTIADTNLKHEPTSSLIFDCVSRRDFLADDFDKELEILKTSIPQFGALSIGEIANRYGAHIDFHNKSIVISYL